MRPLLGILLLLTVGCASNRPAWHTRVSEHFVVPEEEDAASYDFAESFRGQKQFARERALEILLKTRSFSATGVGPTGSEIQPQVYAFKVIAQQHDAPAAFLDLLNRAQPAGKAYALCGLYLVDRPAFIREAPAYRASTAELTVWSGCVGSSIKLGEVVEDRTPEAVRLAKGQSLDDWFDANPDGGILDIVGGSYPAALADVR